MIASNIILLSSNLSASISYNIISNGKDEPQKGATIKGIIDFFEKAIGVNPLTIKKLKIKRKIDLEPNSISGPEAIELL